MLIRGAFLGPGNVERDSEEGCILAPSPDPRYGYRPARTGSWSQALRRPWWWLTRRLNPLQSWLVVMGVIVGLSLLGQRVLALLVAVAWTAYAAYTWFAPSVRRWLGKLRR